MASASAERRQRVLDDARDAQAFVKLGQDLVRAHGAPPPLRLPAAPAIPHRLSPHSPPSRSMRRT
jgi:hypothetical protein